ncbi:MAG: isoleucine--tRNA ligase [Candidatus Omnitrophica bacterium]|nr:isoleucine--tRNA ligase [Candidatus Omnitrophota bacterium]
MDYKDSLNLPKTKFSMKANLPQREPETLKLWNDTGIYEKIKDARSKNEKYVLHDGPPYANGHIHIGHALNKTLKDMVVKYKTMRGYYCEYIPGWDCHGLPVEHQLFKKLKKRKGDIPQVEFRKKAHEYAMGFVDIQKEEFKRLGIFGEWDNPYLTLDRGYEAGIIRSFAKLVEKGYIYQGLKPVNWCYRCETALAEAEVEYEDHTSPSVYVKFRIKESSQFKGEAFILIWTTTPWTLIANVAVAVHPDSEYLLIKSSGQNIILAKQLLEQVVEKSSLGKYEVVATLKGKELEATTYDHPFGLREGKIVLADYVSMEEGTGCVHTAPGHGQEDYLIGQKYGLQTVMPVDAKGRFSDEAGEFKGMNVYEANPLIIDKLKSLNLLLHSEDIAHSYPHCWRCKNPIIFRATEQWFMSVDHNNLRKKILDKIKGVGWIPKQGEERISTMVANRPDWCLSRQRYWGVPIPVFRCKGCDEWIADYKLINYFAEIVEEKGSDCWFELDPKELVPKGYKCKCGSGDFEKGEDIVDVWFESGVSHQSVLKDRKGLGYPCDLYLEGSDQHRGWFQSALITSMGIDGISAFKSVLTHGFVVDGMGRKMSKSFGNVISPQEIIKDFGADILRLWVASSDYNDDVRISNNIIARLTDAYRKIRNTARFALGNLSDFDPDKDRVPYEKMLEIDRWAVSKSHSLLKEIEDSYDSFQFHKVYHKLYTFCVVDMSNFYLDISKDRLYTFKSDSLERRSCQSAMYEVLNILVTAIAPIMVFTAEEIWLQMPKTKGMPESIHMQLWPDTKDLRVDKPLEATYGELKKIRDIVLKVLEAKRSSDIIGSPLEAKVNLYAESDKVRVLLNDYEEKFPELFIVSQASLLGGKAPEGAFRDDNFPEISITVDKAEGSKCTRCWNYSISVGKDKNFPDTCERCQKVLLDMKREV